VAKVVFSSPDRSSTAVQQDSAHTDWSPTAAEHFLCITHLHAVKHGNFMEFWSVERLIATSTSKSERRAWW
jgi:hypothetical protein